MPIIIAPPIGGALIAACGLAGGMRVGFAVSILAVVAVVIVRHFNAETAGPVQVRLRFGSA